MSIRNKNADWGCVEILCKTWELSKKKKTGRGEKRFLRTGRALHSLQAVGEGVSQLKTIKDVWVSMRSGQGGNAHAALVPPLLQLRPPQPPTLRGFRKKLAFVSAGGKRGKSNRDLLARMNYSRPQTVSGGARRCAPVLVFVTVTKRLRMNVEPVVSDQIYMF